MALFRGRKQRGEKSPSRWGGGWDHAKGTIQETIYSVLSAAQRKDFSAGCHAPMSLASGGRTYYLVFLPSASRGTLDCHDAIFTPSLSASRNHRRRCRRRAHHLAAAECNTKLPPSIASLKSMKDQAKPISVEERKARVERARELMAENKLQAIVVTSGSSLPYFSAVHWWPSERLFAMVLPAKGNAFFVCPAFEEGRAREQLEIGPVWSEGRRPHLAGGRRSVSAGGPGFARLGADVPAWWASKKRRRSSSATELPRMFRRCRWRARRR